MSKYLFVLREMIRRDLQNRYAGSILGFLWSFVHPLWQLVLFSFVFSTVMRISLVGERTENFGVFLFCGLLPWAAIQEGVQRGASAITDNSQLVKKLSFPSSLLVVTVALSALVQEAIAGGMFVVVLLILGQLSLESTWLLLPALPLQLALTLGLGFLLAAGNVFFRDISQVVGLFLMGWFYVTPIVYPLSMAEKYASWLELNPVTGLVGIYRAALLGGPPPSLSTWWPLLLAAAVLLPLGWTTLKHYESSFVDEL